MSATSTPAELQPRVATLRLSAHGVSVQGWGELDLAAAPMLAGAITAAIGDGYRHVVIDLGSTTFLDCACLGAILAAVRPLRAERDASLVFAAAKGSVERLLTLLEFDRTCSIVSTVYAATTLASNPDCPRAEGWRTDQRPPGALATDTNPPIQSGGNDELSP
jgi:anti-anti-sigma factor